MFQLIKEILVNIFGEKAASSIWITPLGFNFAINFLWLILKKFFKTSTQYQAAQEAQVEGGTGTFLSIEIIFHLFSFLVMFFILVSINFYLDLNDLPQASYSLWLPSIASIGLGELAKIFSGLKKDEAETILDKRQRQLSWYFVLTIITLAGLWVYMIFGEELEPVFWILSFLDRFLL